MRVIIIAGGDFSFKRKITAEDFVICADSGYDSAKKNGIHINLLMGDMDSVKGDFSEESEKMFFPVRKDYTDSELAVRHAVDMKPDEIVLLGCRGTRADHTLANIFLLKYISKAGINAHIEDEHNEIYYYKDFFEIVNAKGKTVSLIPISSEIKGLRTEGLDYPLENESLFFGETRGVSNMAVSDIARYTSETGEGIIIVSDGV